jgi:hypothetical protein
MSPWPSGVEQREREKGRVVALAVAAAKRAGAQLVALPDPEAGDDLPGGIARKRS